MKDIFSPATHLLWGHSGLQEPFQSCTQRTGSQWFLYNFIFHGFPAELLAGYIMNIILVVSFSCGKADKVLPLLSRTFLISHSLTLSFLQSPYWTFSPPCQYWPCSLDKWCILWFQCEVCIHLSCTLEVNMVATVLLGLVVLFAILAVKSTLFTDGRRSVTEMNRVCSYFAPPE